MPAPTVAAFRLTHQGMEANCADALHQSAHWNSALGAMPRVSAPRRLSCTSDAWPHPQYHTSVGAGTYSIYVTRPRTLLLVCCRSRSERTRDQQTKQCALQQAKPNTVTFQVCDTGHRQIRTDMAALSTGHAKGNAVRARASKHGLHWPVAHSAPSGQERANLATVERAA